MGAPDSINAADVYVLRVYVLCKVYTRKDDDDDDDNVVLVLLTCLFDPVDRKDAGRCVLRDYHRWIFGIRLLHSQ